MADNTDFNDAGSGIAVGVNGAAPQKHDDIIEDALTKQAKDAGAVFETKVLAAFRVMRERSPADYQRFRRRAKDLGASVVELDRLVCANGENGRDGASERTFTVIEIEPWGKAVDLAAVLDEIADTFERYLVLPKKCGQSDRPVVRACALFPGVRALAEAQPPIATKTVWQDPAPGYRFAFRATTRAY